MESIGMEAGSCLRGVATALVVCALLAATEFSASAADYRTRNFIILAPDQQLAVAVGTAAEDFRRDLAMYWTGSELPPWPQPCPIRVVAGANLAAQGVTTYNPRPVKDFQMEVVGTPERILDSVLPHEVTHTILATYFGRPLPRWADEGICTTVEHVSERRKHENKLREFLGTRRGIAMNRLFLLTEYPNDVLPMYAQGYSVCRFMIEQQGPRTFVNFLKDYMQHPSWTTNVRKHYGYESLRELQEYWLAWVEAGSGDVTKFAKLQPRGQSDPATGRPAAPANATPVSLALNPATGSGPNTGSNTAGGWQPNDGKVNLASATSPAALTLTSPAQTALGQVTGEGWYLRNARAKVSDQAPVGSPAQLSNQAQQDGNSPPSAQLEPFMPPSVRSSGIYSAAQPQAEQQGSRGGIPLDRVFVPGSSRWR
jgi:hypothetical protein